MEHYGNEFDDELQDWYVPEGTDLGYELQRLESTLQQSLRREIHFSSPITDRDIHVLLQVQEPVSSISIGMFPKQLPVAEQILFLERLLDFPNVGALTVYIGGTIPRLSSTLRKWAETPRLHVTKLQINNLQMLDPEDIHLVMKAFPHILYLQYHDYISPIEQLSTNEQIQDYLSRSGFYGELEWWNEFLPGGQRKFFVSQESRRLDPKGPDGSGDPINSRKRRRFLEDEDME